MTSRRRVGTSKKCSLLSASGHRVDGVSGELRAARAEVLAHEWTN